MEKTYRYRIYPNKKQKELLQKTFGCCRFVYNYYLSKRILEYENNHKSMSFYDCCKDLTSIKNEYEWLKEPDKCSLQNSLKDLDVAFQRFFKGISKFPKYKSKKNHRYSYRTQNYNLSKSQPAIQLKENYIKLPKLSWIKKKNKQIPQGRILNVSVIHEPSGKYYAYVCCTDINYNPLPKTNNKVGIDMGIKDYVITSDGVKYNSPKYLNQSLHKLKRLQRDLSRKTRGGSNWNKCRIKIAKTYEKISNQRKDYLQKVSTELIRENDIICIEDLNINNMLKNHEFAQNIADMSWGHFIHMLEYKSVWYDREIKRVDVFFPSSQLCCYCGYKNPLIKNTQIRTWVCPQCNSILDRDINAAHNILYSCINKTTVGTTGIA